MSLEGRNLGADFVAIEGKARLKAKTVAGGQADGFNLNARLNALGLMPGKRITKISSMMGQGPVTIEVDRVQLAIGFGMANRIMINLDRVG